ncbi:hypothetical protein EMPS_09219 [Entomortierella parvispora]|uniref:Uncharacterized protein n=1 Tax=Entomortierella parvispora TaxID=205924 RepID=A0A9P3HHL9_9FUNG|nr:hypothetical protein EMPS_09219 [Entomortierella parvispora]
MTRPSHSAIVRLAAGAVVVSIVLLQLYLLRIRQQVEDDSTTRASSVIGLKEAGTSSTLSIISVSGPPTSDLTATSPTPRPTAIHLFNNSDPGLSIKPTDQVDFCNHLVKPRHPREMHLAKSNKEPIKIFTWHSSFGVDWPKESLTMCPIPLVLQPFFDHFLETRIQDSNIKWDVGYAPCILWTLAYGEVSYPKQTCTTSNYGEVDYIITTNYADFEDASIIFF